MIRRGRGAGAGRAGAGPIHRRRSLSVAALHSRQLNDHRALCPRETCDAPSGSTLCWPGHRKRIFIRTLHHNRRRCSAGWHRTHGKAAPPRPGRLCPSRTAVPGLRSGQNGRAHRPVRARTADALAPPGRRRLHRACPAPPLCPSPGRLPTAPAGPAATPSASAASYGWSRPRTAGDSGGAPHESLEAQDPAPSLGFTLPAAAPGGSTHLSPPG